MTVSTRDGRSLALRLAQGLELLELALERELAVVEGDVVQHAALAQLEAERELGQFVGLADAVVGEADRPALLVDAVLGLRRVALAEDGRDLVERVGTRAVEDVVGHDPLAGATGLDQALHVLGREQRPGRQVDVLGLGLGVLGRALAAGSLQGGGAADRLGGLAVVEAPDLEAELGVVRRLPAREAHIVAEARPLARGADEAEPLLAQPAGAVGLPLEHEGAAHALERGAAVGAGLRAAVGEAQGVGGAVRQQGYRPGVGGADRGQRGEEAERGYRVAGHGTVRLRGGASGWAPDVWDQHCARWRRATGGIGQCGRAFSSRASCRTPSRRGCSAITTPS